MPFAGAFRRRRPVSSQSSFLAFGARPEQARFIAGSVQWPTRRQAASARLKAAICVQRGSISKPNRLSRMTAATAAASSSFSSAMRKATSRSNIATTKCPLPMHGSRHLSSFAVFGQPSNVPAAGVQL